MISNTCVCARAYLFGLLCLLEVDCLRLQGAGGHAEHVKDVPIGAIIYSDNLSHPSGFAANESVGINDFKDEVEFLPFERMEVPFDAVKNQPDLRSKPMLWVHIHKAGGSFMCYMASLARERIVQPNANCNYEGHDSWVDGGHTSHAISCKERSRYFRAGHYTWGAIERELWPSDICAPHFSYGVMLRNPIELMTSMMNFVPDIGKQFLDRLRQELDNHSPTLPSATGDRNWKLFDNYHVRVLANAMGEPAGRINASHFENAKSLLLSTFTVVARLEDLTAHHDMFKQLGWGSSVAASVGKKQNPSPNYTWALTSEEKDWLTTVNRFDVALYDAFAPAG